MAKVESLGIKRLESVHYYVRDLERSRRFYTEILPALRDAGRTVLAATHDEQYFHCCDRRVHMAAGRLEIVGDADATA